MTQPVVPSSTENCGVLSRLIVSHRVDAASVESLAAKVIEWAQQGSSRYICFAGVSSVMEAYDSIDVQAVMNQADLVTPDGMPLVWGLWLLGVKSVERVYGPDCMERVMGAAQSAEVPIGFYGVSPLTMRNLLNVVSQRYPTLKIVYSHCPPFSPISSDEDCAVVKAMNESGVRILFVGLGSPKQDVWMAAHHGRVNCVMLGVGAAFDFLAGTKPQAPRWMMRIGLEWLFRLATEPRRLWKRYLKHNPRFMFLFARQLIRARLSR